MGGYPRGQDLATITAQVVCTYGSRSSNYMRPLTRSLARAIPTASVREIGGTAHAVPFDAPGNFAQIITQAIRSAEARPDAGAPTLATTPSAGGTVGTAVLNDTAKVSGGSSPGGSVIFNLYDPGHSDCSGTPAASAANWTPRLRIARRASSWRPRNSPARPKSRSPTSTPGSRRKQYSPTARPVRGTHPSRSRR
jgi:hypothetical protein